MSEDVIERSRKIRENIDLEKLREYGLEIKRGECRSKYSEHHFVQLEGKSISDREIFSEIKDSESLDLYVDIPFCPQRCRFCNFHSFENAGLGAMEAYVSSLKDEIKMYVENADLNSKEIERVYIGGGTPTYLPIEEFKDLLYFLRENLSLTDNSTISVEAYPSTLSGESGKELLNGLRDGGASRISIGAQTFKDDQLKALGRKHSSEDIMESYRNAREAGFESINFDIMIGIPRQTPESFLDDLRKIEELDPETVDLYHLELFNYPMYQYYLKNKETFPSYEETLLMKIMASEFLGDLGYIWKAGGYFESTEPEPFGIENLYREVLGVGLSAISMVNNMKNQNFYDLDKYKDFIERGKLPSLTSKRELREDETGYLIRRLRIDEEMSIEKYKEKFGVSPKEKFSSLRELDKLGLINILPEKIEITYEGKLFISEMIKKLYSEEESYYKFLESKIIMNFESIRTLFMKSRKMIRRKYLDLF